MPLLDADQLALAVELQRRSYNLLRWMADGVTRGFIRFDTAHDYVTLPEAAQRWILKHYNDIPPRARPAQEDLERFSLLFTTYLQNSFNLVRDPGKQLYSPDAHCFCSMCSWLVDAPQLKAKKPTAKDRRRAIKKMHDAVASAALAAEVPLVDEEIDEIAKDSALSEPMAMVAYAHDLLQRMKGVAMGPAALVLWRTFAWNRQGSPKKGFELSAERILQSERVLLDRIDALAEHQSG